MQHANSTIRLRPRFVALYRAGLVLALSGAVVGCDDDAPATGVDASADSGVHTDGSTHDAEVGTDAVGRTDAEATDLMVLDEGGALDLGADADLSDAGPDADVPDGDASADLGRGLPDFGLDGEADAEVDAGSDPDFGQQDRCADFDDLENAGLVAALHRRVHADYRAIEVGNDQGGNLNRYTTARELMFNQVEYVVRADGTGGVECAYTGQFFVGPPNVEPDSNIVNCEHTWPRSMMSDRATLRYSHQESDIHHLQPTVSGANSTRGNFPFGEPVSDRNLNHLPAVLGRDASGRQVFSPRAERRGDVARMMFYFNVRWGIDLPDYEEVVLKAWMAADPVDDRERARNDLVANIQGNRNPFVDCPQFVARIGDFAAFQSIDTDANLPAP